LVAKLSNLEKKEVKNIC